MKAGVLLLALAASGAASGCRAPAHGGDEFSFFFYEPHDPLFVEKKDEAGRLFYETKPWNKSRAARFAKEKPGDAFRVFIVGGSVAGVYDSGSARPSLREVLEKILPGRKVEVINCGITAYNSPRESKVMTEVLGYSPDLIVLMSVFNERQPGLPPAWVARAGRRVERVPLMQGPWRWLLSRVYRPVNDYPRKAARLEANLKEMLRRAKARKVPVVLCTIPMNIRDMPPADALPLDDPRFVAGWVLFERGRLEEAARAFGRCEQAGPWRTAEYYLARSLDLLGRTSEAKPHYVRARDLAQPVLRLNEEVVRRLAREEGAILCDLESVFAKASPEGLTGRDLIEDTAHWFRHADPLVSLSVARALAAGGPQAGLDARWLEKNGAAVEKEVRSAKAAFPGEWSLRLWMWPYLWSEDKAYSEHALALLDSLRLATPDRLEDPVPLRKWLQDQLAGNVWARDGEGSLERWWPTVLGYVAEVHRRHGRFAAALRYFDMSLALRPDMPKFRLHKAIALLQSGQRARALEELRASGLAGRPWVGELWKAYEGEYSGVEKSDNRARSDHG